MTRILCFCALVLAVAASTAAAQPTLAATTSNNVGPHLPGAEDFVAQQYEDFLGRSPDGAGLRYWSDLLDAGTPPSALIEALATSDEFEGVIAPVVRLYFAFFDRAPDHGGLIYWSGLLRHGVTVDQVAQEFARSAEFRATYGRLSDRAYVDLAYRNVLGRPADAGGQAYWLARLSRDLDRGRLMAAFSESTEHRHLTDPRVKATMLYVGMLRRSPDPAGLDYWSGIIAAGTPYREVIGGFLDGAEYGNRLARIFASANPLTGVVTRRPPARPALVAKIDNVDRARPQTAIDRADIVYEEMVEGRLTRLVAVFHSDLPDTVGPVRSVRTTDLDLIDQLGTPLLAASGANPGVLAAVAEAERAGALINVNAIEAGTAYFRSSTRRAPHNLFARTTDLYRAAGGRGGAPDPLFTYRAPGHNPGGRPSAGVDIDFGSTTVGFRWSTEARGWQRTQNGTAHTVASGTTPAGGTTVAPDNVIVLEVTYGTSSIDAESPEARTIGSGRAWVFTAGRVVAATWSRSAPTDPIALHDGDGAPVALTPGQTFVELAPPGSISVR